MVVKLAENSRVYFMQRIDDFSRGISKTEVFCDGYCNVVFGSRCHVCVTFIPCL